MDYEHYWKFAIHPHPTRRENVMGFFSPNLAVGHLQITHGLCILCILEFMHTTTLMNMYQVCVLLIWKIRRLQFGTYILLPPLQHLIEFVVTVNISAEKYQQNFGTTWDWIRSFAINSHSLRTFDRFTFFLSVSRLSVMAQFTWL